MQSAQGQQTIAQGNVLCTALAVSLARTRGGAAAEPIVPEADAELAALEAAAAEAAAAVEEQRNALREKAALEAEAARRAAEPESETDTSDLTDSDEEGEGETSELASSALEAASSGEGSESSDDDLAFIQSNQQEAASSEAHARAVQEAKEAPLSGNSSNMLKKLDRSAKAREKQIAINEGRLRAVLSKEEVALLEWRKSIDFKLLQETGIVRKIRKKRDVDFATQLARRQEHNAKMQRREERRRLADERADAKARWAIERAENKEEARKRQRERIEAKQKRRRERDEKRIDRVSKALTSRANRIMKNAKDKRDKALAKCEEKLANAQKCNRSACVNVVDDDSGSLKLRMFLAPPKAPKQAPKRVVAMPTGYACYDLSVTKLETFDKAGVMPEALLRSDPYKVVRLGVVPTSNGARSTRSSAAVNKRTRERDAEGPLKLTIPNPDAPASAEKRARVE